MTSILRHPATAYVVAGLILYGLAFSLGVSYDEGGARGALFWASRLFGAVFWVVGEVVFKVNSGRAPPGFGAIVLFFSVALALLIDGAIARVKRSRTS